MDGRLLGGRFRLLGSHAMGGMASVWRAMDEETGEIVAVKRLHPHLVADAGARERLVREATAMRSVRHPNVVGIRGAVDGDEPALVMDFVDGRSIAQMAAASHGFTETEALGIAAGIADGLAAAHERGIVHRDVKPDNVLIGADGVVRLSDFGIAVAPDDATALTADDGVVGTLRYLAPERLAGEPATPATDVWGVGAVLYELLAGRAAFPATTLAERVEMAAGPAARPTGLRDATWDVVSRCLASDPQDRFADGAALGVALHRLPGVPPPAASAADPSALTEVIAMPAEVAHEPSITVGPDAAVTAPPMVAHGIRTRSRRAVVAGALGTLAIVIMAAAAMVDDPAGDPPVSTTVSSPRPTAALETPVPTVAAGTSVDTAPEPNGAKGKGDDKGKGKGRGN